MSVHKKREIKTDTKGVTPSKDIYNYSSCLVQNHTESDDSDFDNSTIKNCSDHFELEHKCISSQKRVDRGASSSEDNYSAEIDPREVLILIIGVFIKMEHHLKKYPSKTNLNQEINIIKSILLENSDHFGYKGVRTVEDLFFKKKTVRYNQNKTKTLDKINSSKKTTIKRKKSCTSKSMCSKEATVSLDDQKNSEKQDNKSETPHANDTDEELQVNRQNTLKENRRRSVRARVKPLQYWAGEKLVVDLDGSFKIVARSKSCLPTMQILKNQPRSVKRSKSVSGEPKKVNSRNGNISKSASPSPQKKNVGRKNRNNGIGKGILNTEKKDNVKEVKLNENKNANRRRRSTRPRPDVKPLNCLAASIVKQQRGTKRKRETSRKSKSKSQETTPKHRKHDESPKKNRSARRSLYCSDEWLDSLHSTYYSSSATVSPD